MDEPANGGALHVSPLPKGTKLGRIDAGQDLAVPQRFFVSALGDGHCYQYDPPGARQWGGLGAAFFTLLHPVTWDGRTYHEWYAAECGLYFVHVGAHVQVGAHVAYTRSGWTETGFYAGQDLNSQVPTQAGEDFHAWTLHTWTTEAA